MLWKGFCIKPWQLSSRISAEGIYQVQCTMNLIYNGFITLQKSTQFFFEKVLKTSLQARTPPTTGNKTKQTRRVLHILGFPLRTCLRLGLRGSARSQDILRWVKFEQLKWMGSGSRRYSTWEESVSDFVFTCHAISKSKNLASIFFGLANSFKRCCEKKTPVKRAYVGQISWRKKWGTLSFYN